MWVFKKHALMVEVRLDFETWAREAGFFTYKYGASTTK